MTDATVSQLPALTALTSLHLCAVGATPPILAGSLGALHLTTLVLAWMPLAPAVLPTLRAMTHLRALQLLECRGVQSGDLLEAAARLHGLTKLHLRHVEGGAMGSEVEHGVAAVARQLPALADFSCMGVYGPVMQPLLTHMAGVHNLVRLRLGAPTGRWASQLTALSALTTLTSLQVKCAHFSYTGSWTSVLATLPNLVSLDLSHNFTGHPTSHLFPPSWCLVTNSLVRAMVACTALQSLDLSFTHANTEQLRTLASGLPRLQELTLFGVVVGPSTLRALEAAAPRLHVRAHAFGGVEEVPGVPGRVGRGHRRGGRRRAESVALVLRDKGVASVEGIVTSSS